MKGLVTGMWRFGDPMKGVVYDPATLIALGMSAGTATAVGTAATILGPILSIAGAVSEVGAAREQAAEYERQGTEERLSANVQADMQRRHSRQARMRDRAAMIEGGAFSGTAFGLEAQNFMADELDALMIEYSGQQRGSQADFAASQARREASPLKIFSAAINGFSNMDPFNLAYAGGAAARPSGSVSRSIRPVARPQYG